MLSLKDTCMRFFISGFLFIERTQRILWITHNAIRIYICFNSERQSDSNLIPAVCEKYLVSFSAVSEYAVSFSTLGQCAQFLSQFPLSTRVHKSAWKFYLIPQSWQIHPQQTCWAHFPWRICSCILNVHLYCKSTELYWELPRSWTWTVLQ